MLLRLRFSHYILWDPIAFNFKLFKRKDEVCAWKAKRKRVPSASQVEATSLAVASSMPKLTFGLGRWGRGRFLGGGDSLRLLCAKERSLSA